MHQLKLLSQNDKSHLENVEIVKGDEITLETERVQVKNMANQLHQENVTSASMSSTSCIEYNMKMLSTLFRNQWQTFRLFKRKKWSLILLRLSIQTLILEYLLQPPWQSVSNFFAFRPFLKKCKRYFFFLVQFCMVLTFYKTSGQVFSNKARMTGNGSEETLYL